MAQPLHQWLGMTATQRVGSAILGTCASVGDIVLFGGRALVESLRPPYEFREIWRQMFEIGWRSAPLIAVSGFAIGIVLSMHTRASLERFGAEAMIPAGLALALIRETGPLVTALLVSGRVGAMRVTEQIDALEAVAVDSFKFLAVTRIVACILAMPLLTAIMDFCGIAGGFLAERTISGMSWNLYFHRAFSVIDFQDFIPSTLKTAIFGLIIGTVASYLGFTTSQGTEGVGRASTRSVVMASIVIIVTNVVLVKLIFFLFPTQV